MSTTDKKAAAWDTLVDALDDLARKHRGAGKHDHNLAGSLSALRGLAKDLRGDRQPPETAGNLAARHDVATLTQALAIALRAGLIRGRLDAADLAVLKRAALQLGEVGSSDYIEVEPYVQDRTVAVRCGDGRLAIHVAAANKITITAEPL